MGLVQGHDQRDVAGKTSGLWRGVAERTRQCPTVVLLLFALAFSCALPVISTLQLSSDHTLLMPSGSKKFRALQHLRTSGLPGGILCPVFVVVEMSVESQGASREVALPSQEAPQKCVDFDALFATIMDDDVMSGMNFTSVVNSSFRIQSCAHAEQFLSICTGRLREHAIGLCPRTCGRCDVEIPWLEPQYWDAVVDSAARIRGVLERMGRPCLACVRATTQLPDGTPLVLIDAKILLQTNAAYARHFANLIGFGHTIPRQHVYLELPFDPFSSYGEHFIDLYHDAFDSHGRVGDGCCRALLWDLMEPTVDSAHQVSNVYWALLLGVCAASFLIVGLAFRSVFIPLRLLFTIAFTLVVVFALSVLVFQNLAGLPGLYWMCPLCVTPIIIGLTLDYDLLLVIKIVQYRKRGWSTEDAVVRGCGRTGRTISLAGSIMIVAFASMLSSDLWVIRQFGFCLVIASVVDAFFVRTMLVPALMLAVHSESNWWPRTMPTPFRIDDTASGSEEDEASERRIELPELGQVDEYHSISTPRLHDAG